MSAEPASSPSTTTPPIVFIPAPIDDIKQETKTSCWAACARALLINYGGADDSTTDTKVAQDLGMDVNVCQDMAEVLGKLHFFDDVEKRVFPTATEIADEIKLGRPLVACVTAEKAQVKSKQIKEGHYVLVVGIDQTTRSRPLVKILDPQITTEGVSSARWVPYLNTIYRADDGDSYWGMTYYTHDHRGNR